MKGMAPAMAAKTVNGTREREREREGRKKEESGGGGRGKEGGKEKRGKEGEREGGRISETFLMRSVLFLGFLQAWN